MFTVGFQLGGAGNAPAPPMYAYRRPALAPQPPCMQDHGHVHFAQSYVPAVPASWPSVATPETFCLPVQMPLQLPTRPVQRAEQPPEYRFSADPMPQVMQQSPSFLPVPDGRSQTPARQSHTEAHGSATPSRVRPQTPVRQSRPRVQPPALWQWAPEHSEPFQEPCNTPRAVDARPTTPMKRSDLQSPYGTPPATPRVPARNLPAAPWLSALPSSPVALSTPRGETCHTKRPAALDKLGALLRNQACAEQLYSSGDEEPVVLSALAALAEQALHSCIDYSTLGLGWAHPKTRTEYRRAQHPSATCPASRQRAEASRMRLVEVTAAVASGRLSAKTAVKNLFLQEIGLQANVSAARSATFSGVVAALKAELLLPLRALNEGQQSMHRTYRGEPVPPAAIAETVQELTTAVLSRPGSFADWRYGNPIGLEQLRGLSSNQLTKWREPTSIQHASGVRTHEDGEGELGFFWATKIGGPSHGFDYEGQCLLPLLANARNKVVLVSDIAWPAHPAGRAYFRLLWTAPADGAPEPRLWLEAVNADFDALTAGAVDQAEMVGAVLRHAVAKSCAMQVPLLVDPSLSRDLHVVVSEQDAGGFISLAQDRLLLRPSNGVCEASDYLSARHDWVQLQEEVTDPLPRVVYTPTPRSH